MRAQRTVQGTARNTLNCCPGVNLSQVIPWFTQKSFTHASALASHSGRVDSGMGALYVTERPQVVYNRPMTARLVLAALLLTATASATETYRRVKVTRIENNFYGVANSNVVVQTRMCLQPAMRSDAVLVWDFPGSVNNKLAFLGYDGQTRTICRVERLLIEANP